MSRTDLLTKADAPPVDDGFATLLTRLATDPAVDVTKIGALLDMQERVMRRNAEQAFNEAMSAAQQQMRPVAADANNPQTKSRYASYAALDRALRPIYTDQGFGLSFTTGDSGAADMVRVVCHVSHGAGFARDYHIDMPADGKGAKGGDVMTRTHATGSAVSYGMRYLLKMIFNVAVGEDDDDGQRAGGKAQASTPAGFDDWWSDMTATADEGQAALSAAWAASKGEYKRHVVNTKSRDWNALKAQALKVPARG